MADELNESVPVDDLDDEMADLFAAFDGMGASSDLKAKTLGAIAALPAAGAAGAAGAADASGAAAPKATAGGKTPSSVVKSPFKAIRIAAVAACVSAALVSGAAYALPTSHVTLTQGDTTIELSVNTFGMVVSATSDDEAGRMIIEAGGLTNVMCSDALSRVTGAMSASAPDVPISLMVQSGDAAQRNRLQNEFDALVGDKGDAGGASQGGGAGARSGDQGGSRGAGGSQDGGSHASQPVDAPDDETPSYSGQEPSYGGGSDPLPEPEPGPDPGPEPEPEPEPVDPSPFWIDDGDGGELVIDPGRDDSENWPFGDEPILPPGGGDNPYEDVWNDGSDDADAPDDPVDFSSAGDSDEFDDSDGYDEDDSGYAEEAEGSQAVDYLKESDSVEGSRNSYDGMTE